MVAISHAHTVINWQENLPLKDMPMRWQWHLDHEIENHFEDLEAARGGTSDSGELEAPMMRNALVERDK